MICLRFSVLSILLAMASPLLLTACKKTPIGHPPTTPSQPTGISNGGYNTSYEFCATAADPDSDSVAIRFSWGDGATSEWSGWVASGETAKLSHAWSNASTYQVSAQAKDRPGQTSGWSESLAVQIIATHPPNTPGAPTGPSSARKDSLCTFTTIATDPDGDGVSYRFDWGTGDTSAWSDWLPSGQAISMKYSFRRSGIRQVRAQVRDVNEARSAWSNALTVNVRDPSAPSQPSIPTGPEIGFRTVGYTFSSEAEDVDGDSVSIRFSWGDGDTSDWSNLVQSGVAVGRSHAWSDTGMYFVESQARDEDGALSGWSSEYEFPVSREPKWRYGTGGSVWSSPAIGTDGTIYVGSDDYYLYAINAYGSLAWRYLTGGRISSSPAIAADGTVYVGSEDSYLYAISADGSLKWRYETGGCVYSSPAITADGTVYVGSGDFYLYAISADGSLKWRYETGGCVYSNPAVAADGTVYFGSRDTIYAVNTEGSLVWRYAAHDMANPSPAIASDGTIYAQSFDTLYAINPGGTAKWRRGNGNGFEPPVIGADGTVYIGGSCLYAISPDGSTKWAYGKTVYSTAAVAADGTVYVGCEGRWSELCAVGPDGSPKWRYMTAASVQSSPAIAPDGSIYFGTVDGYLHAVQGYSPLADAPWPKYHHDNRNTGRVGGGRRP